MAFTKAPEYNTHQLQRLPVDPINRFDPERNFFYPTFENCFPVVKGEELVVNKRAPINTVTSWAGLIPRGFWIDPDTNYIYVAYDSEIAVFSSVNPLVLAGTATLFRNEATPIEFCNYKVGTTSYVIAHEPGNTESKLFFWNSGTGPVPTATVTIAVANMANSIIFMDGYIFLAGADAGGGQRIFNSNISNPQTYTIANDFIDAEMYTDKVVALAKHHNHIVAFGRQSIEFFYNAANEIGSPLQRQANYAQKIGTVKQTQLPAPVLEVGDTIYFIGGQNGAYSGVYKMEGFKIEKISDLWVDSYLQSTHGNEVRLCIYDHLGVSCLGIFNGTSGLIFKPDVKYWSLITTPGPVFYSQLANYFNEGGVYLYCQNPLEGNLRLYKSGYKAAGTGNEAPPENIAAIYSPHNISFSTNNQKHIKWVDALGWFGNNQTTLSYTNDLQNVPVSFVSCGAKSQVTQGTKNPLRWRNLGRTRAQRYRVIFSGTSDIEFRGLEIAYNQGTY